MPETSNIQIQRVEEMRLSPSLNNQIADLLALCFKADYQGRTFYQNRHHCRLLIWHDDNLIGHTALAFRAVRQEDDVFDIVGLAEVAVHPDHRGRNFGEQLMNLAFEEGRIAGADFALLFGVRSLYAETGFRAVSNQIKFTPMENTKSGQTTSMTNTHLRAKSLSGKKWDDKTPLDLAGFAF